MLSLIIPVYNRPEEIQELLASLSAQKNKDFEVIIVEDGLQKPCKEVVAKFETQISIQYLVQLGTGVSYRRNYGSSQAKGDFFVYLDSDVIVPPNYTEVLHQKIKDAQIEVFGGPDAGLNDFPPSILAINYAMTSFFTTGGIRGGRKKIGKYYPRSFNMGVSKRVFEDVGGFPQITPPGEDLMFSFEIIRKGYSPVLISEAHVYHKRKANFRKFWRQMKSFGFVRYPVSLLYPRTFSPLLLLPSLFFLGCLGLLGLSFVCVYTLSLFFVYALLIWVDATLKNKSAYIGLLSIVAAYIQLLAYGYGFLKSFTYALCIGKKQFLNLFLNAKLNY